jgi:hypothetical protein
MKAIRDYKGGKLQAEKWLDACLAHQCRISCSCGESFTSLKAFGIHHREKEKEALEQ